MAVPTVSDLLQLANLRVVEGEVTSTCGTCRRQRALSDCRSTVVGLLRSYECAVCGGLVVEIAPRGSKPLEQGCYPAGGWVIRPEIDLFAHIRGFPVRVGAARPDKRTGAAARWALID